MTTSNDKSNHRAACEALRSLAIAANRLEEWYFYNRDSTPPPAVVMEEFEWRVAHALLFFSASNLNDIKQLREKMRTRFQQLGLLAPQEEAAGSVLPGEGAGDA